MSVSLVQHDDDAEALIPPPRRCRTLSWFGGKPQNAWTRARRVLFLAAAILGAVAFVLAVGNRFTGGPLFVYIPEVTLIPPLSHAAWQAAFFQHQQSPLFALCGGYQVGGMESLTVYQMLYLWEWLRIGSVALLSVCLGLLLVLTIREAARAPGQQRALAVLATVTTLLVAYVGLRFLADHAGLFATINIGQHRHAVDVSFASLALALLLVEALQPDRGGERDIGRMLWVAAIVIDIAFGALFQATDAGAVWKTLPGYDGGLLPGNDRLFAFHPLWRNFTENVYFIQTGHRVLSAALWLAALAVWLWRWGHGLTVRRELLLFILLTVEGALGAATLMLDLPVALSIAHQFGGVLVLAAALSRPSALHIEIASFRVMARTAR